MATVDPHSSGSSTSSAPTLPSGLEPLAGGYSGETFAAGVGDERVVVRIYGDRSASRGPAAAEIDSALLRLMRGIVPVPEVLETRRARGELPGLLVTSFVAGERADVLLPRLAHDDRARVGEGLGRILDRLRHIPTLRAGEFVDGDLRIAPFAGYDDGLPGWVESHRARLTRWSARELDALADLAARAQDLLDTVDRTCLVHSDFNPKNLLVDAESLAVTGVLDWEFAHSGSPYADVGNLLRFERDEPFVAGVLRGLDCDDHPNVLDLGRAADLVALVELTARDHDAARSHPVTRAAHALLLAMSAAGDLHAQVRQAAGRAGGGSASSQDP